MAEAVAKVITGLGMQFNKYTSGKLHAIRLVFLPLFLQPSNSALSMHVLPKVNFFPKTGCLVQTHELCSFFDHYLQEMSPEQLLNASLQGVLAPNLDPRKHLLGVYLMDHALDNGLDLRRMALTLYDTSLEGWPSPDELHGGVWQALVRLYSSSKLSFRECANMLCWHPRRPLMFFAECFHGVGHGAVPRHLVAEEFPQYLSTKCPQIAYSSVVDASRFTNAADDCTTFEYHLMLQWCFDGTYHSRSLYLDQRIRSPVDCQYVRDPWFCLKYESGSWFSNTSMIDLLSFQNIAIPPFLDWFAYYAVYKEGGSSVNHLSIISTIAQNSTEIHALADARRKACIRGGVRAFRELRGCLQSLSKLGDFATLECDAYAKILAGSMSYSASEAIRLNFAVHAY